MKIIEKIIQKNLKRKGRNILSISLSLLDHLLERSRFKDDLVTLSGQVDEQGFVPISDIPEPIKEFLAINCVVEEQKPSQEFKQSSNVIIDGLTELLMVSNSSDARKARGERMIMNDLENAFYYYEKYKSEFIDAFKDEQSINIRAQRLAVLMVLRKIMNERPLLEKAYAKLQSLDPTFDLVIGGMREFYTKVDWYSRAGEVRGCVIN